MANTVYTARFIMALVEPDPNSGNIYINAREYKGPAEFQDNMNTHI
jgi:hypothetical protein